MGVLKDGADFDLRIDAGTETVVEGTIGIRNQFSSHWSAMTSALLQHRFADWTVTEQVSGASTTIDDYTVSAALALSASLIFSNTTMAAPIKVALIGDQGVRDNAQAGLSLDASEGTNLLLIQGDLRYNDNTASFFTNRLLTT